MCNEILKLYVFGKGLIKNNKLYIKNFNTNIL